MKNTSVGGILWAIFWLGAGVPLVLAAVVYVLAWGLLGRRPQLLLIALAAVGAWWFGLFLAWGDGFFEQLWIPALLAFISAAGTAAGSARPPRPDPEEFW